MQASAILKSPGFITRQIDEGFVLVPINDNVADMDSLFLLDETGGFLWSKLDTCSTEEELINFMIEEYEISRDVAQSDLADFLNQLEKNKIITKNIQ